jgi:hypothetical protein
MPAQPASAKTGLSRRRSRVRVPSLPLKTSCKLASFVALLGAEDRRSLRKSRAHPEGRKKYLCAGTFAASSSNARLLIPHDSHLGPQETVEMGEDTAWVVSASG